MTGQDIHREIDELVGVPPGTIQASDRLEDLEGWNSMAMMGFISLADKNGVRVPPRQIAGSETVSDLIQLLQKKP